MGKGGEVVIGQIPVMKKNKTTTNKEKTVLFFCSEGKLFFSCVDRTMENEAATG